MILMIISITFRFQAREIVHAFKENISTVNLDIHGQTINITENKHKNGPSSSPYALADKQITPTCIEQYMLHVGVDSEPFFPEF